MGGPGSVRAEPTGHYYRDMNRNTLFAWPRRSAALPELLHRSGRHKGA